jgi:N6-L-threonylcarbamoyladenine synthase
MRMIAFEFEDCVTDILVAKTMEATRQYGPKSIVLAGGVSANDMLREKLEHAAKKAGCHFIAPMKKVYSQDNAAMVGILAYYKACSPK